MKNFLQTLAIFLAFVVLVGLISTITDGFTSSNNRNFGVIVADTEYREDAQGLSFSQGETLQIKHYEGDEKIKLKVTAVAVPRDWDFKVGGTWHSWNQSVARKSADLTEYFDIKIDQDANIITINGTISGMLSGYYNGSEITLPNKLPTSNMLCLEIKSGDTLKLYGNLYATTTGISLDDSYKMLY